MTGLTNPISFTEPNDEEVLESTESGGDIPMLSEDDEFSSFLEMIKSGGEDSFDQPDDETPTELNDGEEDVEDEAEEDSEEESEEDEEDEDGEDEDDDEDEEFQDGSSEVDFDTIITLPNGTELSIEDLSNGYRDGTALETEREAFKQERESFETSSADLSQKLDLAKLEADRVLEDFRDFDWQALATEDPKEFANTKLFVEKYAARSKDIREAQAAINEQAESERNSIQEAKARDAVAQLERDIPDWNRDLYSKVMSHAVELGMSEEAALSLIDVGTIKALVNSLNVTEGKRTVKAKITRKRKASDKVIKPGVKKPTKKAVKTSSFSNENEEFSFFVNSLLK